MSSAQMTLPVKKRKRSPTAEAVLREEIATVPGREPTLEELAIAEEMLARENFQIFVQVIHRSLTGEEFDLEELHRDIIAFLDATFDGKILNGYINIPPRHGKSYLIAMWIAYAFGRYPDCKFIYATYGAELAETTSILVQRILNDETFMRLFPTCRIDTKKGAAREKFMTTAAGEFLARGIEGTIVGHGAGLRGQRGRTRFTGALIFDDLHKPGESASAAQKQAVRKFFTDSFTTRRNNARVPMIGIGQRVDLDDIFGSIDPRDELGQPIGDGTTGLSGKKWTALIIPVLKTDGTTIYPDIFSVQDAEEKKHSSPWTFETQYMQRPYSIEGAMFKVDMIPCIHVRPEGPKMQVRGWDLAARTLQAGKTEPDYTAHVKLVYYYESQQYVIEAGGKFRAKTDEVRAAMKATALKDGYDVKIRGAREPGQAGIAQAEDLTKLLNGYRVNFEQDSKDKVVRAEPLAAQVNVGLVSVLGPHLHAFVCEELRPFPNARHDDFVDACAYAYAEIAIPDEDEASRRRSVAAIMKLGAKYEIGEGLARTSVEPSVARPAGYDEDEELFE